MSTLTDAQKFLADHEAWEAHNASRPYSDRASRAYGATEIVPLISALAEAVGILEAALREIAAGKVHFDRASHDAVLEWIDGQHLLGY